MKHRSSVSSASHLLYIDETVQPTAQPHRRIPYHMQKKVEELERRESLDIIEKVDSPTPWVSPIVAALKPKKSDEIRMCQHATPKQGDQKNQTHHAND